MSKGLVRLYSTHLEAAAFTLADQHFLWVCTGKFVLTSHKRFSSYLH